MARFGLKTLVILAALAALTSCGGGDGGGEMSHIVTEYDPRVLNDIAVDDLDGDERVDLVLARSPYGSEILTSSSTREVSARSFTSTSFFSEGYAQAVAAADIDGDGKKDIAVAEDESVHLLLQTPSGSFVEHSTLSYTAFVGSLSMADLDHDGRNDLVVGLWPTVFAPVVGSGLLVQFQRKEAATFEPPVELPTLSAQHILCDVDGDGWGDVLAAGRGTEAVRR